MEYKVWTRTSFDYDSDHYGCKQRISRSHDALRFFVYFDSDVLTLTSAHRETQSALSLYFIIQNLSYSEINVYIKNYVHFIGRIILSKSIQSLKPR